MVKTEGGIYIKECRPRPTTKLEVNDEKMQKVLWEESDKMITFFETESAMKRAEEKKAKDAKASKETKEEKAPQAKTPGSRRSRKAA